MSTQSFSLYYEQIQSIIDYVSKYNSIIAQMNYLNMQSSDIQQPAYADQAYQSLYAPFSESSANSFASVVTPTLQANSSSFTSQQEAYSALSLQSQNVNISSSSSSAQLLPPHQMLPPTAFQPPSDETLLLPSENYNIYQAQYNSDIIQPNFADASQVSQYSQQYPSAQTQIAFQQPSFVVERNNIATEKD
ncbi:uncharacterized protein MONOS_906 [Monocercomonoides exilis]|uniref:uncharacterized protein n=1 Tax=Monocercomonoides exilis TaxID=2049356 RepID=UPI00355A4310|nr:hypothetical protein MONOS_906 [Monocercomonoides exilis]|eukprot:MONOS_906.1-p1 / transcript=MONOS_906.1 / gene=MONOS_906 / organism=Monocercomonoides_exilis_PA203 / gene_product=unspecified product / transcript_product=unspecified product / location=Mono_scaffold00015:72782-73418(-) / protein_length=191 / sequence_SO=supercontig / SO=protein_coding / is_pseudo=false